MTYITKKPMKIGKKLIRQSKNIEMKKIDEIEIICKEFIALSKETESKTINKIGMLNIFSKPDEKKEGRKKELEKIIFTHYHLLSKELKAEIDCLTT